MVPEDSPEGKFRRNLAYFEGHAILLVIFFLCGIWWTINILRNYQISRVRNDRCNFRSQLWYKGPFTKRLPLESILKMTVCGSILFTIAILCVILEYQCNFHVHSQHVVLLIVFFLSGIIDLMVFYRFRLPEGTDRAFNMLAYAVMGLIFKFHTGHAGPLNTFMHTNILPWICLLVIISHIFECLHPANVIVALARPYFVCVLGLWFMQLAFSLYPIFPWQMPLDENDGHAHSFVPILVCFYLVATALMFLFINFLVVQRHVGYDTISMQEDCQKNALLIKNDYNSPVNE